MKNFLIISLLILSVGFSQQKKTDKPNPMKGVKTQTELLYYYEEKFGESKENLFTKSVNKYDSDGNMVESLRYGYYNSSDFYESIFSYLPKFIDDYYNLNYKWIYKYDSNGNMVEESRYTIKGGLITKTVPKYDANGKEVERSIYDSDGLLDKKYVYTYKYDSNGNKVEKSNYEKGSLMVETFYKYDSDGNMVEESKRDLKGKFEWKYDSNGNMVEELYNKTDGQSSPKVIFINKYDTKNRIIEVISYPKRFDEFKRPTKKTIYEYEEY